MKKLFRKLYLKRIAKIEAALYQEWLEDIHKVATKIYYARIAMNSDAVGDLLMELDALVRYGHRPEEYRGL